MIQHLDPRKILLAIDQIDQMPGSYSLSRAQANRRVAAVLATSVICLLLIHYLKFTSSFYQALSLLSSAFDYPAKHFYWQLKKTEFLPLFSYIWWTFWHVIGYVLIPVVIIKCALRSSVSAMGVGLNDTRQHWAGYVLLLTPILLFVVIASFDSGFLQHYPFYKQASRSLSDLLIWELLYLTQFACLEFFFRGFMLQSLRPALGANALWIMVVPYTMIHFPKLWPEAIGAILFGLLLGVLALRSRSIWGGFFVHAGVAVGMDVASLVAQGRFPSRWWF